MAYKNRKQVMVNVGVPIEFDGQDQDMKALAKRLKISLGRLMWQALQAQYPTELFEIYKERSKADSH